MGAGGASLQMLQEIATDVLERMPPGFNLKVVGEKYPFDYSNSMNTVLRQVCDIVLMHNLCSYYLLCGFQELIRFNRLTSRIKVSLEQLQKATKGQVVMTSDLQEVQSSLLIGRVPQTWLAYEKCQNES
jgi:dynein heavy chain